MRKLLEVNDLKSYFFLKSGVAKAVDGVSFQISRGETLGIVGESGSGKSVTAKSLMRLLDGPGKIVNGEIFFDGKDLLSLSEQEMQKIRGNEISMIFQDPMTSLDPVFRVGEQMTEAILTHQDVSYEEAKTMSIEALDMVGILNPELRFDSYPFQLSGGMCQRVIIAMALCSKSKILIADEPTTALDVTVQSQVLKLMKELQEKTNISIIIITHNLGVIWEMCDNVIVMYAGKPVEYASSRELYKNPMHPYTWGLFSSIPRISDNSKSELKTIPGIPPDLRLTGHGCNFWNRCRFCQDKCMSVVPDMVEVSPGHFVACNFQTKDEQLLKCKDGE